MTISARSLGRSHNAHGRALRETRVGAVAIALACFIVLLLSRTHVLNQPPTWDGAMGMTPAALTLASSGFDVRDLLQQQTYEDGGPNTHATSLATFTTAAIILVAGSYESALPILHLGSFVVAAMLVAGTYLLVARSTGAHVAGLLAALLTLLYPPFIVQASDVYLDLPLAAAMVWSLVFAMDRRFALSVIAASIAVWIKPTGVILLPVLAHLRASHTEGRISVRRLAPLAIPAALAAATLLITSSGTAGPEPLSTVQRIVFTLHRTHWYTQRNPSLLIMMVLVLLGLATSATRRATDPPSQPAQRLITASTIGVLSTLVFYLLNPLLTSGHALLPRYTVAVAPILAVLCTTTIWLRRERLGLVVVASSCLLLFIAGGGWISPIRPNNYALSERDLAYEYHLQVQRDAIQHLDELATSMPIFVDHFTYFRFRYPEMGWVSRRPLQMTPVYLSDADAHDIDQLPDSFAMLFENDWLGGETIRALWDAALSSSVRTVDVHEYSAAGFENYVVVVRTTDPSQSVPADLSGDPIRSAIT